MRKVSFVVVMVLAAFAGGAVVNGPGVAWAQALVRLMARGKDFVRVVSADPNAPAATTTAATFPPAESKGNEPQQKSGAPSAPVVQRDVPAAPLPPLVLNRSKSGDGTKDSGNPKEFASDSAASTKTGLLASNSNGGSDAPAPPASLPSSAIELPTPVPPPISAAMPQDPPLTPPNSEGVNSSLKALVLAGEKDPALNRVGTDPDKAPPTAPAASPLASSPPSANGNALLDWPALRRRLKDAGVSRYEIDGEFAGRVRFRCVIPIAGRRAIGQLFEGEGDDEFQAAESALKRIQLWKVSESPAGP